MRAVGNTFVDVALAYVCWWNLDDVAVLRPAGGLMTGPLRWFGYLVQVDQHWGMLAPAVFKDDGWYTLEGTTATSRVLGPEPRRRASLLRQAGVGGGAVQQRPVAQIL